GMREEGVSGRGGHGGMGQRLGLSGREHRQDVWVLQLGGEHDLVLETLEIHAGREMGREHFHHDTTTERALLRQKHATHATAAELAFYAIRAGQRGLQPISKIDLQVLNLRCEQSRDEGRYVRSTLTAAARHRSRRALTSSSVTCETRSRHFLLIVAGLDPT